MALDIAGGQITSINSIVNPDKLRHLGPVGDLAIAAEVGELKNHSKRECQRKERPNADRPGDKQQSDAHALPSGSEQRRVGA